MSEAHRMSVPSGQSACVSFLTLGTSASSYGCCAARTAASLPNVEASNSESSGHRGEAANGSPPTTNLLLTSTDLVVAPSSPTSLPVSLKIFRTALSDRSFTPNRSAACSHDVQP